MPRCRAAAFDPRKQSSPIHIVPTIKMPSKAQLGPPLSAFCAPSPSAAMTVSPASPPPNLRVFAKVARTAPSGAVAAVVRFYLRGARQPQRRPLHGGVPVGGPAPTLQRTFQFGELRAFLEAGRARAAVAGMLSLLPLDLEAACFQAWVGFISSVLGVAASRSMRRNLGGIIGIVRIDSLGAAEGEEKGDGAGDGFSSSAPPSEDPSTAKASEAAAARSAGEDGGGFEGCSCPICYESLGGGAKVATTPCGHGFHEACIGRWLSSRPTCPVCRFEVPD
ncbi:hypothetical protein Taro_038498 [Colocasia esculenta]|uniref:RING-type domain-containing protein n=1 Tax=Colocasia esculenta TaxID=4460 RepID=A0A843WE19_COLES|nr:hypothetical protein [Colocasia esculenta]